MLSVVDLLEAGTLTERQTAWLLSRILQGASWLVGAKPGGAGKTTVMSALLAMAPRGAPVWLTNRGSGWQECKAGNYLVSYELSPGFYEAYIWGADVVRMTELGMAGCRIVSNLHADTLEQARKQIVVECGAAAEGFQAFQIFIPLSLEGSRFAYTSIVEQIDYVQDGIWCRLGREELEKPVAIKHSAREWPAAAKIAEFLTRCRTRNIHVIEDVRKEWLEWCDRNNLKL
jgi:hypothetical protein